MKALNMKDAEESLHVAFEDTARNVRLLRVAAEDALEEARHSIKTRPIAMVSGAAAIGLIVGLAAGWVVSKR